MKITKHKEKKKAEKKQQNNKTKMSRRYQLWWKKVCHDVFEESLECYCLSPKYSKRFHYSIMSDLKFCKSKLQNSPKWRNCWKKGFSIPKTFQLFELFSDNAWVNIYLIFFFFIITFYLCDHIYIDILCIKSIEEV